MKKALLIGINYVGTPDELSGCINDVNQMKALLVNTYGFNPKNITMLTDDGKNTLPTGVNIEKYIKWLLLGVKIGDSLVFHYSGHGNSIKDDNADEHDGLDEVIIPVDADTNGVISDDDIFGNLISKVPKGVNLTMFMDCCHSGTVADLEWNFECIEGASEDKGDQCFTLWQEHGNAIKGNVCMFSGSSDADTSADAYIGGRAQGAFTFCLLDVLKGKTTGIKYRDVLKEVNTRLSNGKFTQRSQFSCSSLVSFDSVFVL